MNLSLPTRDIVLLGAGHTHAHLLRQWRMAPLADTRLTCVTNFLTATYSGMLPGTLAGLYEPHEMEIDLVRLCAASGIRLIQAQVHGLDLDRQCLLCSERPEIPFDVLSIGIGSVAQTHGIELDQDCVVAIKPMQTFLQRFEARMRMVQNRDTADGPHVVVVGGGAGGVEIAFSVKTWMQRHGVKGNPRVTLLDRNTRLASGAREATVRRIQRRLADRDIAIRLGVEVTSVVDGHVHLHDGETIASDLVVWTTGAAAPELISRLGLPVDERGFLLTRPTLQTVAEAPIFAVGDTGTIQQNPVPKAGVYAVRQGPVLWNNVRHQLRGEPLEPYEPQRGFLSLMSTGDSRAIMNYKWFSFEGRWCWRLKDWIDRRFMAMYQDYTPAMMGESVPDASVVDSSRRSQQAPPPAHTPANQDKSPTQGARLNQAGLPARPARANQDASHGPEIAPRQNSSPLAAAMRCTGCGGKVSGPILRRVLDRLDVPASDRVLLGLDAPDDAAIVRPQDGHPLVMTTDFFSAFLDDPYVVGRVALLNAASDVFAMGARPLAAMAIVTLPLGDARQQEQLLWELLSGGVHELQQMDATLVGGHTIEGPQLAIGYSMLAELSRTEACTKARLRPGLRLILTKPLGTGILLAAQMRARCRADWLPPLLETMLCSNREAAEIALRHDITAMTDVTGFGLAGHLLEMLHASDVAARVNLDAVPLLPGVAELVEAGIESTLAPSNRETTAEFSTAAEISTIAAQGESAQFSALFDPQTAGGLLIGVDPAHEVQLLDQLHAAGYPQAVCIGEVEAHTSQAARIHLV